MMRVNPSVAGIPLSGIRAIMDLAAAQPGAIRLEIGDPDFATPAHIVAAAYRAAASLRMGYTPNTGLPDLRDALAAKIKDRNGYSVSPDQVVLTQGATQGIFTGLTAVMEPGNEVLLPDPAWPNYLMMANLLRLSPVRYSLAAENNYLPDLDQLTTLVTPATRALLINSPSNPLGTVFGHETIAALADFAEAHDLWLISDECYDEMLFGGSHVSVATIAPERTISAYSFSKTYAMTGWRVGYLAFPEHIGPSIAKCQETILACINAPAQHAAITALTGDQTCVSHMRDTYRRRRDLVAQMAVSAQIEMPAPAGAFYAWLSIKGSGLTADQFARRLLGEQQVAVAPGSAFGEVGDQYVRISLTTEDALLAEGMKRLTDFLGALKGG
jgi:aspartate aminotransferase